MAQKAKKRSFDTSNESVDVAVEFGKRKKFHPNDLISVRPRTANQKKFFSLYNAETPLILLNGTAGTGKSFLSMYAALHDVVSPEHPQEQVIVVRSAVESGQSQGFLPGTEEQKQEPYEMPYKQLSGQIIPRYKDTYDHLKNLGYLEFMTTTHIRGITLDNTVVIVEECQNLDYDEIRSIVGRAGENTRVLITGDEAQDDLKRQKRQNGLQRLRDVMLNMPFDMTGEVTFNTGDIVRSGLCKAFLISDAETHPE